MAEGPSVSVIVLNYNGAHLLPECLGSLLAQDPPAEEILVVDNGSVDDSAAVIARYPVRFLPLGANYGFSVANNRGAAAAAGDFLFFVNNDMRFDKDCTPRLQEALEENPSRFAADPRQMDWSGVRTIHGHVQFRAGTFDDMVIPPLAVDYVGRSDTTVEVPWGCAGSLMVRASMFRELRGFDPTFFIDFEDVDLCWRAWLRGWPTVYVPAAVLHHKVGMSGDEHQHLMQTDGRTLPRLWFRRRVSYHTNYLRFALKTLPAPLLLRVALLQAARSAAHLARGNYKVALAIVLAFAKNAARLPDSLAERRRIQRTRVLDSATLLRRFDAAAVQQEGQGIREGRP